MAHPPEPPALPGDEGLSVEGGLTTVAQQVNAGGSATGQRQSALSYRGDLMATLPAGQVGEGRGTLVGHLRVGQGEGVALRPSYTSTANTTAFQPSAGADDSYAILAQAYYQVQWQLDGGRFNEQEGDRAELTIGKMDLFGFFDQNEVADNEADGFMNNAFVHNPLLDSGGDIGADLFGFAPGVHAAYHRVGESWAYSASIGVFGAGEGANFSAGPSRPLVIGQLTLSPMQINGEARGNYRLYAWRNGRTADLDGERQTHTGIGLSIDQRIGREWNVFARAGKRLSGEGLFDEALTLGLEHGGRAWGRNHDALGLALGWLHTGDGWRDATRDGSREGYAASGHEFIAELYYRFKVNEHLHLSPDYQYIRRAGGDGSAPSAHLLGLRATLGF